MKRDVWNERYAAQELVWSAGPNQFLVAEAADLAPGAALDVAAGEGRNAVWLAQRGWRVTAVDFSDVGLEKARRRAAAAGVHVETVCVDVTTWEPPAEAFDLVLVFYLQLPPPERRAAHRLAASGVAPGGVLLVVGHDRTNLTEGHGGPQDDAVLFTPEDVVDDLDGTGLVVERAERVRRRVETDDGAREAIDALVRLRRPS